MRNSDNTGNLLANIMLMLAVWISMAASINEFIA
jgi:hypothetical protein